VSSVFLFFFCRTDSCCQFETVKRMQAYYRSLKGEDGPVSPEERHALKHAMIDYGALQPSPVQKPADTKGTDSTIVRNSIAQEVCFRFGLPSLCTCLLCVATSKSSTKRPYISANVDAKWL
jgi:hypothetical protein